MANTIKIKRGLSSNIDNTILAQGELAITTDTNELYVGVEGGKKRLGSDVVIIYGTDDESTVVKKLAEAIDGPDLTGNPAKIKKECIYYETGVPEWSRIYKLVDLASSVVESPFTSVTFSGGYGTLTMKIERGEEVNGEYQYIITKTTDSYEQISNKIDEIGVKSYVSSSEYPSEKAVVDYVNKKVVQSNYSQNDEQAADYIKNRLFYTSAETLFSGEATVTKEANSDKTIITIPFSDSFKKSDLKCVWMITISFGNGYQNRLHRWNWNYEHGSSSDYEYKFLDLFMRENGFTIKSNDNGLEVISVNHNMSSDEYAQATSTTTSVILASNVKTEQLCLAPIEGIIELTTDPQ